MHILFSVNHPSQYHVFKNLANKLLFSGNKVVFFIQRRGIIEELVRSGGFTYKYSVLLSIRKYFNGKIGIIIRGIFNLLQEEMTIFTYNVFNRVDFMMGTDIAIAHIGSLFQRPSFLFTDDDYFIVKSYSNLGFPFATHVVASEACDIGRWTSKKISYLGTQKISYTHPKYFSPNKEILNKYNLTNQKFFIIRLVTFNALHDVLHETDVGIDENILEKIILLLKQHGEVIINSEGTNIKKFSEYYRKIDPEDMHHLLYYSKLFISESQSMTIEASLLGTPSVRMNKWVTNKNTIGVIEYLEKKYELCYNVKPNDEKRILEICENLLSFDSKAMWKEKNILFYKENTNVTDFLFWFINNYPNSIKEYKNVLCEFK